MSAHSFELPVNTKTGPLSMDIRGWVYLRAAVSHYHSFATVILSQNHGGNDVAVNISEYNSG